MNKFEIDLKETFRSKKVLITGHTGFKGSWLSGWLNILGAKIIGVSKDIPSEPSHYLEMKIENEIKNYKLNIQDLHKLKELILAEEPDYIFHLAAQSLVRKSYNNPLDTWKTNLMGTINILESIRNLEKCTAVIITSDKCYDNKEWEHGYKETDELGGSDPYSASKGSAEIAIRSYNESYLTDDKIRVASARAGNVIGGGDWAADRIVPDCVRSWSIGKSVELRNPNATRPWQHVLEPLSGYLKLVSKMSDFWEKVDWKIIPETNNNYNESQLLKLNCEKAYNLLNWKTTLNFEETVRFTSEWYSNFYTKKKPTIEITKDQIKEFMSIYSSRY